jgi:hypothetical protein
MRTTEQAGAAPHADGPTVAIIVGSTRPGRKADTVARWTAMLDELVAHATKLR